MKKWAGLLLAFLLLLGATASAAVRIGDRAEDTVSTVEALKQTLGLTTLPMGTGGLDAFLAYKQPGIPFSVLIDADGTVRAMHLGVATAEGRLDALNDIRKKSLFGQPFRAPKGLFAWGKWRKIARVRALSPRYRSRCNPYLRRPYAARRSRPAC